MKQQQSTTNHNQNERSSYAQNPDVPTYIIIPSHIKSVPDSVRIRANTREITATYSKTWFLEWLNCGGRIHTAYGHQ